MKRLPVRMLVATVALVALPAAARADQCQLFDEAVAAKVRTIVERPMKYAELCEPCGEKVPGLPFTPSRAQVGDELSLDGKGYDLAYLYVQTSPARFENLALLVGCPVHDVSPSLRVESETSDGVLITADRTPVKIVTDPIPAQVAEPSPPPPPPPAVAPTPNVTTNYSTTIVYTIPWLAIAAAAGGIGFLLGVAATLILLGLRRRRAMEPRASRLV